jgi:hypothetical protein
MNGDENEFEKDGKTYVAVEGGGCESCAMHIDDNCIGLGDNTTIPWCGMNDRADKRNVYFKEKQ